MHDPMTVICDIKYPWRRRGSRSQWWPKGYRETFITLWHVDPEKGGHHGNRSDDSCGWHTPPTTPDEREKIAKIGEGEYGFWFRKRAQEQKGDPEGFACVCHMPETTYDVVYWAWRRIKYELREGRGYKFGSSAVALTRAEEQSVRSLATNPMDSIQYAVRDCDHPEKLGNIFVTVWRCYLRHHRPWFKHPRWHIWHWRVQVRPLQKLHRRLFVRCAECGKRFGWNESPIGSWGGNKIWHESCDRRVNIRPPVEKVAS